MHLLCLLRFERGLQDTYKALDDGVSSSFGRKVQQCGRRHSRSEPDRLMVLTIVYSRCALRLRVNRPCLPNVTLYEAPSYIRKPEVEYRDSSMMTSILNGAVAGPSLGSDILSVFFLRVLTLHLVQKQKACNLLSF